MFNSGTASPLERASADTICTVPGALPEPGRILAVNPLQQIEVRKGPYRFGGWNARA